MRVYVCMNVRVYDASMYSLETFFSVLNKKVLFLSKPSVVVRVVKIFRSP